MKSNRGNGWEACGVGGGTDGDLVWEEREGVRMEKKGIDRQKTQIDMAGGMQRQVVCGGMCINESAGLHLVRAPLKETEGQKKWSCNDMFWWRVKSLGVKTQDLIVCDLPDKERIVEKIENLKK